MCVCVGQTDMAPKCKNMMLQAGTQWRVQRGGNKRSSRFHMHFLQNSGSLSVTLQQNICFITCPQLNNDPDTHPMTFSNGKQLNASVKEFSLAPKFKGAILI